MKKPSLPRNKTFALVWLIFHIAIIAPALFTIVKNHEVNLDADLFNMLPKPDIGKAMGVADEKLTEMTGQNVFILVSHEDFDTAKHVAENVYSQLEGSSRFKSVSLYSDSSAISEVTDFIHKYRWNLLDDEAIEMLATEDGAQVFAENALAKAYSAFTFSSLDTLQDDPFMLGEYTLTNYLSSLQNSGTAMSPRDGVLATQYDGLWYVMIRGILSKEGAALASKSNAAVQIYEVCEPLEKDGVRFVYSGTPFHSYKSSTSASNEIALISTVTLGAIIILLLIVFKNPLPIVYSIASILLSILAAFSMTYSCFGKIHILTLVFGTSLIGSCIDYSLHFFIHWKANRTLASGAEIRRHLLVGLALSLVSTELCYLILVFAPFGLLKQMAVFSLTGIMSAFLTVISMYPLLTVPKERTREIALLNYFAAPKWYNKKKFGRIALSAVFAITIATLLVNHRNVKIENDIARLYEAQGRVRDDEVLAWNVLNYNPSGWFIIAGDTVEETLVEEERLCKRLGEVNAGKERGGYIATSQYIPSVAKQKASRAACQNLLPLAPFQYEALGYDVTQADTLSAAFRDEQFATPDGTIPEYLAAAISTAWLGNIDGRYYSIVLPVSITDEDAYNALADESPNVYFENKIKDIGRDLDKLTKTILSLFALAYVVIIVVLKFFYSWKHTLKIASIPLLIVLVIASIFATTGTALEFFSITGMILVFGLGLDYVIYMIENEKRADTTPNAKLEPFAILLSFLTTAVSFGALALSSFVPVHMLGLSIFLGLTTAFFCTIL
ncbi:MAG: MMPL family transporter [Treponema sp.]|nr:MMPL family transporter [Treponema sp.]